MMLMFQVILAESTFNEEENCYVFNFKGTSTKVQFPTFRFEAPDLPTAKSYFIPQEINSSITIL